MDTESSSAAPPPARPWMLTATCLGCGYALRGLSEDRCPECGREFDPFDPRTMHAPGWQLTRPYTRTALCRRCSYPLRDLPDARCPECGERFDPEDPWTMRIPGWKPPPTPRPPASFGGTVITLAAGATVITVGSAYDANLILSLYGLVLWLGVPAAWVSRRAGAWRPPAGPRWRFAVACMLVLTALVAVSYERCPHARYVGWGALPIAVTGDRCNNPRHFRPIMTWLWE